MKWVKYVIAFLVPILMVLVMNHGLDNDSWYVLAEGREIVENGIYHEDMLSMHEGLHVVVQNYGFAAIFYLIHLVFGAPGIYIMMLVLFFVILLLLYKICMLISDKNVKLSLILMAVTGVMLALGYVVTRAQMLDYVVLLTLIYVMELFIKTDKSKYLWWIPVLSLVLANLHASSWWMIFAIMVPYIIDGLRRPRKILQGYGLKSLILVFVISLVVGLANPYGLEMLTSAIGGYGELKSLDYVAEIQSFNPLTSIIGFLEYFMIVTMLTLYVYAKEKVRMRYLLMFFGFLMLAMSSVKSLGEVILVVVFPLAYAYKDWKVPKLFYDKKIGQVITVWMGITLICFTSVVLVTTLNMIEDRPGKAAEEAMNVIDESIGDKNRRELKIYVGFNQGGYVEYRGYPAYLDPRAEYYFKRLNKKQDILKERMDLDNGKIKVEDFLGKYDFDYLFVEEYYEDALKDLKDERYELIYSDEENETRIYKKVDVRE